MKHNLELLLERQLDVLCEIRDIGNQLLDLERKVHVGKMSLQWGQAFNTHESITQAISELRPFKPQGETNMPGKETDTQTVPCSEVETDGAGNPVTLDPTSVTWTISDSTVATLVQNPDGSATFKAVKPIAPAVNPRTANVTCTDTKTGVVGADTLEVDDSPTQPGKMTLVFGTPA